MPQNLFAYGTLQPEFAPPSVRHILRQFKFVGSGRTGGLLYDFGNYPGAIFDGRLESKIHGSVYRLPDDKSIWKTLDRYEGVPSLYLRVRRSVTLDDGTALDCWAYAYQRPVDEGKLIRSGRYGQ